MGMLLEGKLEFQWRDGNVHVTDEAGQRVSLTLSSFYAGIGSALALARRIDAEQGMARVVELPAHR